MQHASIHIADFRRIQVLYDLDLANKSIGRMIKRFSQILALVVFLVVLVPMAIIMAMVSVAITQPMLYLLIKDLKKAIDIIPNQSRRDLMESLILIKDVQKRFSRIKSHSKSSKTGMRYFTVFYGDRFDVSNRYLEILRHKVEKTAYPNRHKPPTEEQTNRLLEQTKRIQERHLQYA